MKDKPKVASGSFRVPNSVIQGMTTATRASLNKLSAFQTVTLLGLLTRVSDKQPGKEVSMTIAELLEIIAVSRSVAHTVQRTWELNNGERRQKVYRCRRFSPAHESKVQSALLELYDSSVVIRRRDKASMEERIVHVLDSFGYRYERQGRPLDLDDLPAGSEKVNVGSADRPVYRLRQPNSARKRFESATAILFRINKELADELSNRPGTIGFTLVAKKVFPLFRKFMSSPVAIRLILLVLRQTQETFSRVLCRLLKDLGLDTTHPARAIDQLQVLLTELQKVGLVRTFDIRQPEDRVHVNVNRFWYSTGDTLRLSA